MLTYLTIFLLVIVVISNGVHDAPASISTSVSTRAISIRFATIISAVFNFIGVLVFVVLLPKLYHTMLNIYNFDGEDKIKYIFVALIVTILYSVLTDKLNIPSSSSNALIASLIGANIAMSKIGSLNIKLVLVVIALLFVATFIAMIMGYLIAYVIRILYKNSDRRKTHKKFKKMQIVSAAINSMMHGAQDGQKLLFVFGLLSVSADLNENVLLKSFIVALLLTVGTSLGALKAVRSMGMNLSKMESFEGVAADFGSAITIFVFTVMGLPVSTTQCTIASVMGVGVKKRISNVNWGFTFFQLVSKLCSFPFCILLAYGISKIFIGG